MSETNMNQKTAIVFGATGAVGKQLLKDVLINGKYTKVIAMGRRNVQLDDSVPQDKLVQKTIDFDNLEAHREDFKNVSDVFCCLGTTRKDSSDKELYRKIDQGYVLNSAKIIAEENKPNDGSNLSPVHFLYCSSTGANKDSFFFYPKLKGETEYGLEESGFKKVSLFRPGFLEPVEKRFPPRFMENIAFGIYRPINNLFGLDHIIGVDTVGRAMRKAAEDSSIKAKDNQTSKIGSIVNIFSNSEIHEVGGNTKN